MEASDNDLELTMNQDIENSVRSDRVFDNIFTLDSEEVQNWTAHFKKRAKIEEIFKPIWEQMRNPSLICRNIVGTFWHQFSALVPKIMCTGAGKLSNNEMRHYVIQPIFEELGKRNHKAIHPDIFLDCIDEIGISSKIRYDLLKLHLYKLPLLFLENSMGTSITDHETLGIFLGLEINAVENIETLIDSLSHSEESKKQILNSTFFRIHRVAEEEHIRLNIANFLRFCPSEYDKDNFLKGFDISVFFWKKYWQCISDIINVEKII